MTAKGEAQLILKLMLACSPLTAITQTQTYLRVTGLCPALTRPVMVTAAKAHDSS